MVQFFALSLKWGAFKFGHIQEFWFNTHNEELVKLFVIQQSVDPLFAGFE